ncbi:MAG TPA: cell division protein FtsQ [Rhodospirillaceae bacterium]|nr:MAG: hypothetical protein A2018_07895 [Alphaproteobacteria bacterium GWF2_58_20]HAU30006.1 cell division protein FtsQ [Rhodospirillaceae bacterium]
MTAMPRKNISRRQAPRLLQRTFYALVGLWALVTAGVCIHLWWEGWFLTATEQLAETALDMTRRAGLSVANIRVTGRNMTSGEDLLSSLGVTQGDPILSFSPEMAREKIANLSWVKTVRVQRQMPDTLFITITERKPYALWQYHHKLALVDETGAVLERENLNPFRALKIVVGEDAARRARDILPLLAAQPEIERRTDAVIHVGGRRWDLKMANNVLVKLPEDDPGFALAQLADLQAEQGLLDRKVAVIDLRLPGRISLQIAGETQKDSPLRISQSRKEGVKTQ